MGGGRKTVGRIFVLSTAAAAWFVGWILAIQWIPDAWGALQPVGLFIAIIGMIPFLSAAHRARGSKNPYEKYENPGTKE